MLPQAQPQQEGSALLFQMAQLSTARVRKGPPALLRHALPPSRARQRMCLSQAAPPRYEHGLSQVCAQFGCRPHMHKMPECSSSSLVSLTFTFGLAPRVQRGGSLGLQANCTAPSYRCPVGDCSYFLDKPVYDQVLLPGNCVESATHYLCGDISVVLPAAQAALNGQCVGDCRCGRHYRSAACTVLQTLLSSPVTCSAASDDVGAVFQDASDMAAVAQKF